MFKDIMDKESTPLYTGLDKVKFRGMVKPGDRIKIDISTKKERHPFYFMHGELSVDGKVCANGDFSFAIM